MFSTILLQIATGTDTIVNNPTVSQAIQSPQAKQQTLSFWDLVVKGGPIMIPIAFLSIAAVYLFIDRYIVIRKAGKIDHNFMNSIKDLVTNGNIDAAKSLCKNTDTPIGRMVGKGLRRLGRPINEIENSMEAVGKLEVAHMEKNLSLLGTIAGIAPMFGFLGTIFGVIKIFYNIALADNISIGLIAEGLYEKMITSAAGLMIGIIAFVFHHILIVMIDRTVNKIEGHSLEFVDLIQEPAA